MTEVNILTEKFRQDLFNLTGSNYCVSLKKYKNYKTMEISPEIIITEVAKYFNITIQELKKKTREREYINRKFICIALIRQLCEFETLRSIGGMFHNLDHATIINSLKKFKDYYATEKGFKNDTDNIKKILLQIQNNTL